MKEAVVKIISITSILTWVCALGWSIEKTSVKTDVTEQFCKEVGGWVDGMLVPSEDEYIKSKVATPVSDGFVIEHFDKVGWAIFDVRSNSDVVMGKIPKTIHLMADYLDASKNRFVKSEIINSINSYRKFHKSEEMIKESDLANHNYILFCNGRKCHRSSFAACELRKWGVPFEKIHIYLGGYPEWREKGLPVR